MKLDTTRDRGIAVLRPDVPRLDAAVAPAFRTAALEVVNGGERRVLLDLGAVDYLDSSGLGAMVSILKAVGSGGQVCVCNAREPVLQLFKLTRMDRVFPIVGSVDEGVQRLAGG
jgi:anti-sigma B factor antagonist